ncbi:MAG TPA: hypothetical protein ENN67_02475 [Firmicutes bacterium]|nr:hypothetical protein [Bacillota bacterium]
MNPDSLDTRPDFTSDLSKNWHLVTVIGIALVLSMCLGIRGIYPTWGDETFTIRIASGSWDDFVREIKMDVHPPLYFALCFMVSMGAKDIFQSMEYTRGVSYVIFCLTMWLCYTLLKSRVRSMEELLFPMLLIVSSAHLALFGPMLRYYSLATLGAICATLLLLPETGYKPSIDRKPLFSAHVWYAVALLTAFASSYLTAVIIPAHLVYLLKRSRDKAKPFLISLGFAIFISLPLLLLSFSQIKMHQEFFNTPNLLGLIIGIIARMIFSLYSFAIGESFRPWDWFYTIPAFIALLLIVFPFRQSSEKNPTGLMITTLLISLPLGAITLSLTGVGIEFSASRLMFLAPMMLIPLGMSAADVPGKKSGNSARKIALLFLVGINLLSTFFYATQNSAIQSTYIIPWEKISEKVYENVEDNTLVLYDDDTLAYWIYWSKPDKMININTLDDLSVTDGFNRVIIVYSPRDITSSGILGEVLERLDANYRWAENWNYLIEDEQSIRFKSILLRRSIEPIKKVLRIYDSAG